MGQFLSEVLRFFWDVFFNFAGVIIGGAVSALVGLYEYWRDREISKIDKKRIFKFGLVAYLIVAFFVAWQDQFRKAQQFEKDKSDLLKEKSNLTAKIQEKDERITDLRQQLILQKSEQLHEKTARRYIREQLGKFVDEGRQLRKRCENEVQAPLEQTVDWRRRVREFLTKSLDHSFASRFEDDSNLLPISPIIVKSKAHEECWITVDRRLARLQEFLKELVR